VSIFDLEEVAKKTVAGKRVHEVVSCQVIATTGFLVLFGARVVHISLGACDTSDARLSLNLH
jgi:hypothetical protein